MKIRIACIFAAMVLAVSIPVYAEDNMSFIEDEETGEVETDKDTSSKDNTDKKDSSSKSSSTKSSAKKEQDKTETKTEEKTNPFNDVAASSWYYDYVLDVYEKGLMAGTADDMFSPDATLTRGMVASIVYRMEGSPKVEYKTLFTDIPDGQWYTSGVIWAAENGIIAGYGNGLCGPNDSVTIEQLASILYRYSGSPSADLSVLDKYSDMSMISDYAKTAMSWAVSKDMTEGAQLHSKSAATRAEAAKMFSIL